MQLLGSLFQIVLFTGVVGSCFTVLLLFLQKVLRLVLPVWAGMLGAAFYLIPVIRPQVRLISPEKTFWLMGYQLAAVVWMVGAGAFLVYYLLRGWLAWRAVKRYAACEDERLIRIYSACADRLKIRRVPPLLWGALEDPACVVTLLHPAVILHREVISRLSDHEIQIVLCHELSHVKRRHHLAGRIYDAVAVFHWFNPLMWIAKHEFSCTCEMDCDQYTLTLLPQVESKKYAEAMLHLMELSARTGGKRFGGIGALGFFTVKQRFVNILHWPSRRRSVAAFILVLLCVVFTAALSVTVSGAMFYPYPAYSMGDYEYAETAAD